MLFVVEIVQELLTGVIFEFINPAITPHIFVKATSSTRGQETPVCIIGTIIMYWLLMV